jgi:hypothetical protein
MDIYAVGLLAYELLTGVSPFTGPSPRETLAAQLTRDPQPLHELSAEVPRTLSDLIMHCLAKDPAARPQRADDILRELDSMTMPIGATPQAGGGNATPRKRSWMGVAAVAILFAVLGGVGYVVTRSRPAVQQPGVPTPPAKISNESLVTRAAVASGVAPPTTPAKPLISHEDSVQIAKAVQRKLDAARARDSVSKAKLAEQTERKMIDSIIAANSGAAIATAPTGPRRLVIAEPGDIRQWPEATLLGRAVADSLRRMLRSRTRQYTVVDADSVRSALGQTRDLSRTARQLNSELIVAIRLLTLPRDSAMLMLQVYDLGAVNTHRLRVAGGQAVAKNEVLANLDASLLATLTNLDEMSRAPRRPPAPTLPPPDRP